MGVFKIIEKNCLQANFLRVPTTQILLKLKTYSNLKVGGLGFCMNFLLFRSSHNFIKKEILAQVFFCEFCEISKNAFFTEHLWATASVLL